MTQANKHKESLINLQDLRDRFNYNPDSGVFTYAKTVSSSRAGAAAGTLHSSGYVHISINNRIYKAHRLAWYYVYGVWPADQIDHINGVRNDNRLCNLREVNRSENFQNQHKAHKNNSSGLMGAYLDKATGRWYSRIQTNHERIDLGRYNTAQEAHCAYACAKKQVHMGREELKEFLNETCRN